MPKRFKDILTLFAFIVAIIFTATIDNFLLAVTMWGLIGYSFSWTLEQNVKFGISLVIDDEEEEEDV